MTEQLYRRRASDPVPLAECPVGLFESDSGELCVKSEYGVDSYIVSTGESFWGGAKNPTELRAVMVTPVEYEPLPAPAPEALYRVVQRILSEYGIAAPREAAEKIALSATFTAYAAIEVADAEEPAPAPDAREALEIAKAALRRISDACPATCDMTVAHGMAAVADEALARIGGGA